MFGYFGVATKNDQLDTRRIHVWVSFWWSCYVSFSDPQNQSPTVDASEFLEGPQKNCLILYMGFTGFFKKNLLIGAP